MPRCTAGRDPDAFHLDTPLNGSDAESDIALLVRAAHGLALQHLRLLVVRLLIPPFLLGKLYELAQLAVCVEQLEAAQKYRDDDGTCQALLLMLAIPTCRGETLECRGRPYKYQLLPQLPAREEVLGHVRSCCGQEEGGRVLGGECW